MTAVLLDAKQASDLLGVPVATLQDWRYKRIGPPFIKVGAHVRYRADAIDRWLDAQTVQTEGAR